MGIKRKTWKVHWADKESLGDWHIKDKSVM